MGRRVGRKSKVSGRKSHVESKDLTREIPALPGRATLAQPVLRELTGATGETCHVAVWNESGRVLIIAVNDSVHPLGASSRPGMLALAHCSATGKVLLAFNHLERLDQEAPPAGREHRTGRSIVDTPALERELRRVIAMGCAVDNEEYHLGVRCVAAPVRDAQGARVRGDRNHCVHDAASGERRRSGVALGQDRGGKTLR
ncbi:MAG: IclR family transcriptional regulator, partial [Opitutaceae bacterium]